MLPPDNEWIHAPYLVFDARRVLASVRPFSRTVHGNAYSIPSIAIDLGARVRYLDDASLQVIGSCTPTSDGHLVSLNSAIEGTQWAIPGLIHELGHAAGGDLSLNCLGQLRKVAERNAWLRGIYVSISRALAELVLEGRATVREIASRCYVPELIIRIRVGLAVLLGEYEGDAERAGEMVRHQLLTLEQWFEDGRARAFREWAIA